MKTILMATDFSKASRNAADYAGQLARWLSARLILYHAFQQPDIPVTETVPAVPVSDISSAVEDTLAAEIARIRESSNIPITAHCNEALPADGILAATEECQAQMIIVGAKHFAGKIGGWMGSTVAAMVRRTYVPLLVIPEHAVFEPIFSIALAYDSDLAPDDDKHVVDALKQLAYRFEAKMYLVHIAKNELQEIYQVFNPPFRLTGILHRLDPVVETIMNKTVSAGLEVFVREQHIQLLSMMPEKRSIFRRLFGGTTTRSMIFNIRVPLLIMPGFHQGNRWWSPKAHRGYVVSFR